MRQAKIGSVITTHFWDGANIVLDISGSMVNTYLRGVNLIKDKSGYFLFNAHGDVVQHGSKGYKYDAFGNELATNANDVNPFRYAGEYFDKETECYYLRARYYEPSTGRFLTEDPIKSGLNFYTYCVGNPVLLVDPSGFIGVIAQYSAKKAGYTYKEGKPLVLTASIDGMSYYEVFRTIEIVYNGVDMKLYELLGDFYFVDEMLIIESDVLVNRFGMNRSKVEQDGLDMFESADHAALAWGLKYWGISNESRAEHISYIYNSGNNNGYFFDYAHTTGDLKEVTNPRVLSGYEVVASIHSHPFIWYINGDKFSDVDYEAAYWTGVPVYLVSGSGKVRAADVHLDDGWVVPTYDDTIYSGLKFD